MCDDDDDDDDDDGIDNKFSMVDTEYQRDVLGALDHNKVGLVLSKYLHGVPKDPSGNFCPTNN